MPIHPNAHQCLHYKVEGTRCGSPALTGKQYCYYHVRIRRRKKELDLPDVEDPNAVLVAINDILQAMAAGHIEIKHGTAMLYAIQLARDTMRQVTAGRPPEPEEQDLESLARKLAYEMMDMEVPPLSADPAAPDKDDDK
jgi:hypothetical protein